MKNTSIPQKDITVSVCIDGENREIKTHTNEYPSLMMLIYDRIYTEGFGECLGMGKCGTCLIEIISSRHQLTDYDRNEDTTLLKSGHAGKDVRLSCQLMVDQNMNGLAIKVLP